MNQRIFEATQQAVNAVKTSEHDRNKIASCLFNEQSMIAKSNYRPESLSDHFAANVKIGDSSQFIHSEVGCLFNTDFETDDAFIVVTDPPCPNCAKAIAECGIKHVYIDHKGLDKDFAKRRGDDFKSLSLLIFERAGIHVSIVYRKQKRIEDLITPAITTRTPPAGIEFFDCEASTDLQDIHKIFRVRQPHSDWACAKIRESNGHVTGILVFEGLPPGVTPHDYLAKKDDNAKYSLTIDPVNRLMYYVTRKNATIVDNEISSNLIPSSRSFVNMTGFGIERLNIGSIAANKPSYRDAMQTMQSHDIMKIKMV